MLRTVSRFHVIISLHEATFQEMRAICSGIDRKMVLWILILLLLKKKKKQKKLLNTSPHHYHDTINTNQAAYDHLKRYCALGSF